MKKAIVLSAFGSANKNALQPFLDTIHDIHTAFPACAIRLAFTSRTIRKIWHQRAADREFRREHPEIPDFFYNCQTPLSLLANLQGEGFKKIVVQPLYLVQGAEFYDLQAMVNALRSIQTFRVKNSPFPFLALGRPFLGINGDTHSYHHDLEKMAMALEDDLKKAQESGRTLVYAGHGNPFYSTSFYSELEVRLQTRSNVPVFCSTLEGWPDLPHLLSRLQAANIKKILLKPFLFISGKHSHEDIAGEGSNAWLPVLYENGIDVELDLTPLGHLPQVRQILVQHILDAADQEKIDLLN